MQLPAAEEVGRGPDADADGEDERVVLVQRDLDAEGVPDPGNQRLDTSALLPPRSILYSWSTIFPFAMSRSPSTSIENDREAA